MDQGLHEQQAHPRRMKHFRLPLLLAMIMVSSIGAAKFPEVSYPDGFRSWSHVTSALINDDHPAAPRYAGMHHIHANALAMRGYQTGTFPVGAVLTFDVHSVVIAKGTVSPTTRKFLDVMERRPNGWRFIEFDADSRTKITVSGAQAEKACAVCHASAARDHVFSSLQD